MFGPLGSTPAIIGGASTSDWGTNQWWLAGGGNAPLVAYQPKGAPFQAASYFNLVTPNTNNAIPMVAPTWTSSGGWSFNGSTQWLRAGSLTDNAENISMIFRYADVVSKLTQFQVFCGTTRFRISPDIPPGYGTGNRLCYFRSNTPSSLNLPTPTSGVAAICGRNGYKDGVREISNMSYSSTLSRQIAIGAEGSSTTTASIFCQTKILAFAFFDYTLNDAQVLALTTAMQAL